MTGVLPAGTLRFSPVSPPRSSQHMQPRNLAAAQADGVPRTARPP